MKVADIYIGQYYVLNIGDDQNNVDAVIQVNEYLNENPAFASCIDDHYDCAAAWIDGDLHLHQTVWNEYIQRKATEEEKKEFLLRMHVK